jgi:hypothetical protein
MTRLRMKRSIAILLLCSLAVLASAAEAAEKFQKLTGSQIRARLSGMDMTDNVHWRDTYAGDGTLISFGMGRKTLGSWRVEKDELCVTRGKEDGNCYQVRVAGKKVELRREGSSRPFEGVLEKPVTRRSP